MSTIEYLADVDLPWQLGRHEGVLPGMLVAGMRA
jgi:hypothetical protein